jgi:hypothetical protein
MGYTLTTNNQPRPLLAWAELPEKARAEFDYVEEPDQWSPRFVCYRGQWVDCHDAQRIEPDSGRVHRMGWAVRVHPGEPLARFDALATDSYFSGLAWRFVGPFGDSVVLARFYS